MLIACEPGKKEFLSFKFRYIKTFFFCFCETTLIKSFLNGFNNDFFKFLVIGNGKGKVGKATFLEGIISSLPTLGAGQSAFRIHFEWDDDMGIPGAFYIKNFMQTEFFLVSLTLDDIPNHGSIYFVCNSWLYNAKHYKSDRIFFANKVQYMKQSCSRFGLN